MHSVGSFAPFNVSLRKHNTMVVLMNFTILIGAFHFKKPRLMKNVHLSQYPLCYNFLIDREYQNDIKTRQNFHCALMHAKILSYIKQNFKLLAIITNKHCLKVFAIF